MAYVMGVVTPGTPGPSSENLVWTAASGGTGPYSYVIYRSTATGFIPGAGNQVGTVGVGILTFTDTGLFPNTQYYYVVQSVDTGNASATENATQVSALTAPFFQSMNQFQMTPFLATLDQAYNYNTKSYMIDPGVTGLVYPGAAVKRTQPSTTEGIRFCTPCTSAADACIGFIIYSYKDPYFTGLSTVHLAQEGDVIRLFCTVTGNLTTQPFGELDLATVGGVKPGSGSDNNTVVVEFLDPPVAGTIVRCQVKVPNKSLVF